MSLVLRMLQGLGLRPTVYIGPVDEAGNPLKRGDHASFMGNEHVVESLSIGKSPDGKISFYRAKLERNGPLVDTRALRRIVVSSLSNTP